MDFFNTDHLKSDFRKQAAGGARVTLVTQVSIYGIQTIGNLILARLLTPDDFGLVAMVFYFSFLLQNFGVNGFIEAVIQKENIHHRQISTLFWINVSLSFILMLLFMASTPFIAWFYKEPRLEPIVLAISASILLSGLSVQHLALLMRNMQFYKTSANELVATLISVGISIAMACWGWGYWSLVARSLVSVLMITGGAWILCRWRPGLPGRGTGVRPMLRFAFNTYGNFVMNYFSRHTDKILIGRFHGSLPLGYYDRAYNLSTIIPSQILSPLNKVAVAIFSRLSDDHDKYRHTYLTLISILAFVGMPLSAALTLNSTDLVLLLLGPQWEKAGQIFFAFGPSICVAILYVTHGWLHISLGKPERWFRWGIIASIVNILFFVAGLPFGALGVAVAYSVSSYILIGPALWYAGKPIQLKLSSVLSSIWKYYVSALIAGLLCWFILHKVDLTSNIFKEFNILLRIITSVSLCISIYVFLVVALHQSIKPISQFISVVNEMVPKISGRNVLKVRD